MKQSIEHGMSVRRFGDGPQNIVYLHGLGGAGLTFSPLITHPELDTDAFTHVVPDLPGYGRSPWPERLQSLDEQSDVLINWLQEFSYAPLLVGHSLGGVLSLLIAERAPDVIRGIVNIEGNVSIGDCTYSAALARHSEKDLLAGGFVSILDQALADATRGPGQRLFHATMQFADPLTTLRHARDLVAISEPGDMAHRMAALRVPCTYVAGFPDGTCAASRAFLDEAGVRWLGVEPAGHWVHLEQVAQTAAIVADAWPGL